MDVVGLVDSIMNRESWVQSALCAQTDPEQFFPDKGGNPKPAKQICWGCPVRQQCLAYALNRGEVYGIWGGVTARDRQRMRRTLDPAVSEKCRRGHKYSDWGRRSDGSCVKCRRDSERRYDASRRRIA